MTTPIELVEVDDEFTEMYDAQIPRVDLVGKAANGIGRFLLMKSDHTGLIAPDAVRSLIAKTDAAAAAADTRKESTVTVTGTPADIARLIHNAPVRKETSMPDTDPADVAKAGDLDASEVLAEPAAGDDAPGDPNTPGSPAWEAVDAATAQKWTGILARAKAALGVMADREMQEAVSGAGDGDGTAWDLEDAGCAIDYAIGILAPFAVGEQAEADQGAEAADLMKSLAGFDTGQLDAFEGLAPVVKAGRTLSAANESAIRGAVDSLTKVLNSLPQPTDDSGQPVAKEIAVTEPTKPDTDDGGPVAALLKSAPRLTQRQILQAINDGCEIVKAKGDPQMAVFDADGKLVGTVDPGDLSPIAAAAPPEGGDAQGASDDTTTPDGSDTSGGNADDPANGDDPSGNDVTAGVATPPDATTTADTDAAAVIPGTATVQSPPATDDDTVKKADLAALTEGLTALAEQIGKNADLAAQVEVLKESVATLGRRPDDRNSPHVNGSIGAAGVASRDGQVADPFAELQKAVDTADNPAAKREAQQQLAYAKTRARFA